MKKTIVSLLTGLGLAVSAPASLPAQVEPAAGQWKTWVIASGSALRLPPPPDAASTAAEIQWVKKSGANLPRGHYSRSLSGMRGAGYRWMELTEQLAVSEGLSGPYQTRAMALVAAAIDDSTVAAWDSKYFYMRQYPSQITPPSQP